jgi:hypothetical protein
LKKRIVISGKLLFSAVGAITSGLATVMVVAAGAVVVVVISTGSILAAIWRESRTENIPPDWHSIPGRSISKDARVIE